MKNFNLKLSTSPYSEREAWEFLKSYGPELNISIRQLASLWKWHKSKVERFLKTLRCETLIETKISQGKTTIIILSNPAVIDTDNVSIRDNFEDSNESITLDYSKDNVYQDNFGDKVEIAAAQVIEDVKQNVETESRQIKSNIDFILGSKEEKKKRSKKRKEEIKEKPLLKEGQKEKNLPKAFSRNQVVVLRNSLSDESSEESLEVLEEISTKLPVPKRYPGSVTAEDIIDWAEKNLPKTLNVNWELERFKEYHHYRGNKPVKNAVEFFKGWLKQATKFKNNENNNNNNLKSHSGGNYHEFIKYSQNRKSKTEFEKFLAGGARAIDELRGSGLVWEVNR